LVTGVGGGGEKLRVDVDVRAGDEVGSAGDNRDVAVEWAVVGLHLDVHGLNEKSGMAAVTSARIADRLVEAGGAEELTAVEAGVVDEGIYLRAICISRVGAEGRLA
jgi:hypothetical protein